MLEMQGLVKLVEECGELIQIAAKKMTRMETDDHWDGNGSISKRMENEIGDVMAAIAIVTENFNLSEQNITRRADRKYDLFREWMKEQNNESITA